MTINTNGFFNFGRTIIFRDVQNWIEDNFNINGSELYIGRNTDSDNINAERINSQNIFTNSNNGVFALVGSLKFQYKAKCKNLERNKFLYLH